ncbi:MAG: D-alanine--D-alanine ligase [Pseudomonadota bacterium]
MASAKRIAVLKGGWSAERDVSLVSGAKCADALRSGGFDVVEIDAGRDVANHIADAAPDVVFNALHGRWGEDGCVQGLLEVLEIPYTHSGVLASALAMDKEKSKAVFRAAGLPAAESLVTTRGEAAARHLMEPPYVVKPVAEGSSVGVFIIRPGDNRPPEALAAKEWTLGDRVMVEKFVPGRELTTAVMGDKALGVTEIVPRTAFYDYEAKYADGGSDHVLPADIPPEIEAEALRIALAAHRELGCRGLTRADYRYDDAPGGAGLVLLEINTQPGMTPTSLSPEQAALRGVSFEELVRWIVEDASCER